MDSLPITKSELSESETDFTSEDSLVFSSGYKPEPLAWQSASNPERTQWSLALFQFIALHIQELDQAKDIDTFCFEYSTLTRDQKINLWGALFAATSYFESNWNPSANAVDVGVSSDINTWSVGLLQMSVVDQINHRLNFAFNFSDLQNPIKNLQLGVTIMVRQVIKYGIVLIPVGSKGLYWSTLHPGGKHDRTTSIAKMTKKLSFCR